MMHHIIIPTYCFTFMIPKCNLGFLNTVKENGASATSFIGLGIPKCSLIG